MGRVNELDISPRAPVCGLILKKSSASLKERATLDWTHSHTFLRESRFACLPYKLISESPAQAERPWLRYCQKHQGGAQQGDILLEHGLIHLSSLRIPISPVVVHPDRDRNQEDD